MISVMSLFCLKGKYDDCYSNKFLRIAAACILTGNMLYYICLNLFDFGNKKDGRSRQKKK